MQIKLGNKVLAAVVLAVSCLTMVFAITFASTTPKDNIRENPYTDMPQELMDDRLEFMLGYFATPFSSTSFTTRDGMGLFDQEYNLGKASFLGMEFDVRVWYPNELSQYPCSMTLSQEGFNPYEFKSELEAAFGEPATESAGALISYFVPNTHTVIRFNYGRITIEDRSHPCIRRSSEYSARMLSSGNDLSGSGLTRELTDSYDTDGLRSERSYREYSYYDESGDLVGVKTVWGDGSESDTIFSDHEDEYSELP